MAASILSDLFCVRYADEVSVGDEVLAQGIDEFTPEKVLNVSTFTWQGNNNFCLIFIMYLHKYCFNKVLIIYANFMIGNI